MVTDERLAYLRGIGEQHEAMSDAWYEAIRRRDAEMTDEERDALSAELRSSLDRRIEEQARQAVNPEAVGPIARRGITGAEADIEANYPGGYAAFVRDEPRDRTPRHRGEIDGY